MGNALICWGVVHMMIGVAYIGYKVTEQPMDGKELNSCLKLTSKWFLLTIAMVAVGVGI